MVHKISISTLSVVVMVFFSTLNAQDNYIKVDIDQDSIYLGNTAQLSYSLKNIKGNFIPPEIDSCIVRNTFQSTNTQIRDGKITSTQEFKYNVLPLTVGIHTIPSVTVVSDNDSITSSELILKVLPNPDNPERMYLNPEEPIYETPRQRKKSTPEKEKKELPPDTKVIRT